MLKKNAGVDVVQYSGALSGIGIRGFRPQFSGINKRSLLLIDGPPWTIHPLVRGIVREALEVDPLTAPPAASQCATLRATP